MQAQYTPEVIARFWAKVNKTDGCWLWTASINNRGYGQFAYRQGKGGYAHRFSYELAYGPIPNGMFVRHRCDTPPCVRPDHLILGTQLDNMRDMVLRGRHATMKGTAHLLRGSQHPHAQLTEEDVRAIRALAQTGRFSHRQIAALFGVTRPNIGVILRGNGWSHVD
jgi:hypothetical protein